MLDNAQVRALSPLLIQGMKDVGHDIIVKKDYQPTNQGLPEKPALFLHKIGDRRIGFPGRKDEWVEANPPTIPVGYMKHTERCWYETTWQLSALAIQNPKKPNDPTASDLVNYAAYVMQSQNMLIGLRDSGIGILRVMGVRNPYFVDDKNRFEANPSFDFTLTHEQVIISTSPVALTEEFQIKRI